MWKEKCSVSSGKVQCLNDFAFSDSVELAMWVSQVHVTLVQSY